MTRPTLALGLLLLVAGCEQRNAETVGSQFLAFGTLTEVQIHDTDLSSSQDALRELEIMFQQMHDEWHAWQTGPLTQTNEAIAKGVTIKPDPGIRELIEKALPLAVSSEHLFNPAIGKLVALWGFHSDDPSNSQPPADSLIEQLVTQQPRLTDLHLDSDSLYSTSTTVALDFGAFGKGVGIETAANKLIALNKANAIINSGGDLKVLGSRSGTPWRIAVRRADGHGILGIIDARPGEAFFTSGDYERNYQWQGKTYHHIIDPRTGYPAEGTRSVTVIHTDAGIADAAATALFVAGPDNWQQIARKMEIEYVLLVDSDNNLHMNPKMQNRLQLRNQNHVIVMSEPL